MSRKRNEISFLRLFWESQIEALGSSTGNSLYLFVARTTASWCHIKLFEFIKFFHSGIGSKVRLVRFHLIRLQFSRIFHEVYSRNQLCLDMGCVRWSSLRCECQRNEHYFRWLVLDLQERCQWSVSYSKNKLIWWIASILWNFIYPYFAKLLHTCVMRSIVW